MKAAPRVGPVGIGRGREESVHHAARSAASPPRHAFRHGRSGRPCVRAVGRRGRPARPWGFGRQNICPALGFRAEARYSASARRRPRRSPRGLFGQLLFPRDSGRGATSVARVNPRLWTHSASRPQRSEDRPGRAAASPRPTVDCPMGRQGVRLPARRRGLPVVGALLSAPTRARGRRRHDGWGERQRQRRAKPAGGRR